jgi:hypothetical protein
MLIFYISIKHTIGVTSQGCLFQLKECDTLYDPILSEISEPSALYIFFFLTKTSKNTVLRQLLEDTTTVGTSLKSFHIDI